MSASQIRKKQEERSLQTLREIASQPHNKRCVECQQRGPTYADMTTLSFVCTTCSGHLRGLNPPHRLKSISMTTFTDSEIELLRGGGNEVSKGKWLSKWDAKKDKEPDNKDDGQLIHFLREKYERRRWYSEVPVKPQTDTSAQKEPSQISISKPPEVVKSPQRQPSLEARPRPTQSNSQSSLSASGSSTKEPTPPTKPKPNLFAGQNDPFGPTPSMSESPSTRKKPPPGAVAVLPPGGASLLPGQQSDDFGAFTSSQSSKKNDLASVSLQGVGTTGVTGSSSLSGVSSGPDKYSALAQLDVAVKEVTLKDNPPSNEKSSESWGSSSSSQNVNPFGAAPAGVTQPQHNPFMAGGPAMQQQGFGQFVSAQPQAMPQQSGWGQPQGPMYNNPQQAGFNAQLQAQFQGQPGFPGAGGFAQQPQQQGMFGVAQFSGGFPQQQGQWQAQPTQQMSQQRPQQRPQQQQWQQQQQQQPVFASTSQSFGVSKSTSATSASSATSTNLQLGWSSGLSKPIATTSAAVETTTSGGGTGWSSNLAAPAPQPSGQINWNTPAASANMQPQNWGGSGSPMQSGGGWGSAGQQQPMFGGVPQQQQQQNQMFGNAPAFGQPNQMYMAQQPQMFGAAGVAPQQQMFGMPNQQQQPQQSFGTWSQNPNPQQQQGGFNWNNQAMPGGGLQRKDSKNIIVGNWGTQPSNFQQGDMTNYVPNNMNTSSNPFTASSNKGTSNNPFL